MLGTARVGTALVFAVLLTNMAFAQSSAPTPPADSTKQIAASNAPAIPSMPADPAAILELGARLNGLHAPEISPWHIKATYQLFKPNGKPSSSGTYEEFWYSDKSYKRTYTSATFTQTEYATERGLYRSGSQDWPGRPETEVRMYLTAPIPAKLDLHDLQLKKESLSVGAAHLQCVALSLTGAFLSSSVYCFEPDRPILRLDLSPDGLSQNLYNNVVEFQGHFIARDISMTYRKKTTLAIHVDAIGALPASGANEIVPPPDATGPLAGRLVVPAETMTSFVLVQIVPIYPASAKEMRVQGVVLVHVTVGKDGVVTGADAISGPDLLRSPAVDAVRKWIYRPFIFLGDHTEVETNVKVIFTLGD